MRLSEIEKLEKNAEILCSEVTMTGEPVLITGAKTGPVVLMPLDLYNRLKAEAYKAGEKKE